MLARNDYLAIARARALERLDGGQLVEAIIGMIWDLGQHKMLREHPGNRIGAMLLMNPTKRRDPTIVRRYIEACR
jgi:hypothetical protein